MKKKTFKILTLLLSTVLISSIILQPVGIEAHQATMGAQIVGNEVIGEQYDVLVYPNSRTSVPKRDHSFLMRRFDDWSPKEAWLKSFAPNDGIQSVKEGLQLQLTLEDEPTKIEGFNQYQIEFIFSITNDGVTFVPATQELQYNEAGQYYIYPSEIKGYKLEFVNNSGITQRVDCEANVTHEIKLNYAAMSADQLHGLAPLDQWYDSQLVNEEAKQVTQKIFIIQPEIKGSIKYQLLDENTVVPAWDTASVLENATVQLIERTVNGDKVVAETLTDANGNYHFSSLDPTGTPYLIDDSQDTLYINIENESYSAWVPEQDSFVNGNLVNVGRITDISRYDQSFSSAFTRIRWNSVFKPIHTEGEVAADVKGILTTEYIAPKESSVLINYVDTELNELATSKIVNGFVGDSYKTTPIEIDNYKLLRTEGEEEGKFTESQTVITYVYEKVVQPVIEGKLIVNYVDEAGLTLANSDTFVAEVGTAYQTKAKSIPNYEVKRVDGKESGLYASDDTTVTYVYDKVVQPVIEGKLIVNYVDEAGLTLAKSDTFVAEVGTAYQTKAKSIPNYEVKRVDGKESGLYASEDTTVVYVYSKIVEPVKQGKLIVNYIDDEGKQLSPRETFNGNVGDDFDINPKSIDGFHLTEIKGELKGKYTDDETVVTLIYSKDKAIEHKGIVRIDYRDLDGNALAATHMLTGELGSPYTASARLFDGYKLVEVKGAETGVFTELDAQIIYVYEKEKVQPAPQQESQNEKPKTGVHSDLVFPSAMIIISGAFAISLFIVMKKLEKEAKK